MTSYLAPSVAMGELRGAGAPPLVLTEDDALWMARSLVGEGGAAVARSPEGAAIVSTILRRHYVYSLARGAHAWPTLASLIRAFSQPVNPRWAEGGDLAERHGSTAAQYARRERVASMPWSEIPEGVRTLVLGMFSGRARLTARTAVDFAAPSLYARHGLDVSSAEARARTAPDAVRARHPSIRGTYVHVPGAPVGGNVFVSSEASRRAPEPSVQGAGAGEGGGGKAVLLVAAAAAWAAKAGWV